MKTIIFFFSIIIMTFVFFVQCSKERIEEKEQINEYEPINNYFDTKKQAEQEFVIKELKYGQIKQT